MTQSIHYQTFHSKLGEMVIGSFSDSLCLLDYHQRDKRTMVDNRLRNGLRAQFVQKTSEVIEEAKRQLNEYLDGARTVFSLPLTPVGSDFQKQVWDALLQIPYGKTASYKNVAQAIDNKKAVRAVAAANGANALAIIVPCHRIIGNDGSLVGYGGGLHRKKLLLSLEQKHELWAE